MKWLLLLLNTSILYIACNPIRNGRVCDVLPNDDVICRTYKQAVVRKIESYMSQDTTTKEGPYYEFASNGDTLIKGYYSNNKLIGSYIEYFGGKTPKKYICFDSYHEDTIFYRTYSRRGQVLSQGGKVFCPAGYDEGKLKTDSILKVLNVIIDPPRTKVTVTSTIFNREVVDDTLRPSKSYFEKRQNKLVFSTEFKVKKRGKYRVNDQIEFFDSAKNENLEWKEFYLFEF